MKKINKIRTMLLTLSAVVLVGCGTTSGGSSSTNTNTNGTDSNTIPDEIDISDDVTNIEDNTNSEATTDEKVVDVPSDAISVALTQDGVNATTGITVDSNVITITKDGNYSFSGTLTDGYIVVKKNIYAHIYLNGVNITSSTGSPIVMKKDSSHDDASIVTLVKGTTNTLTDANLETYTSGDYDDDDQEFKNNATLFAKRSLTINGEGTLNIKSYYHQGIHSKNNLKVLGGNITIDAYDHGMKGDTNVSILGGTLNVSSTNGDGVKTDEPDEGDAYDATLYNAKFSDTNLTIDAKYDGIQIYNMIYFEDGTYNITTDGGVSNRAEYLKNPDLDDNGNVVYEDDGDISYPSSKAIKTSLDWSSTMEDGSSSIYIKDGAFTIDGVDDAFNANNAIIVDGGVFDIKAGDDGMHADAKYVLNAGDINISTCYEGLEAANMTFNGGTVNLIASDDGINASNKHGTVADGQYDEACQMYFNGSTITIDASGDGIDSNGCAQFNAGIIYVNGPTGDGDSSIDTNGGYVINGGTLIAVGSSGMIEIPKSNGSQYSATLSATISKGTKIAIKDDSNNDIMSYTATKSASSIIFSSSDLKSGATYHLYINGSESKSWTQSSISYSDITATNGMNEGRPGGQGQPGGGNNPGPGH